MTKLSALLVAILVLFCQITFSQSLGTIQNSTNPALPASYNFREYVFPEPNDQGNCNGSTNASAVIQQILFAQTHRLAIDNPLFFIIGYRPALLQVAITGSGTAPDIKVSGTMNGSPLGELCLAGPSNLSTTLDLDVANFSDYFSVTLPKNWIKDGLQLTISTGNVSRTLTPSELKIGPYTEMNLVEVDLDILDYNTSPHLNPIFDDFLQELASAIPASVVRYGVFPVTLKFPEYIASNETEQLVRLTQKSDKEPNGITSDGSINSVAALFLSKMHRSTQDYLSTVYFGNTLNLRPGGWGGGKSFVGFDFTDIFIHELGHALSLPHWGESAYGINPNNNQYLYPYGGVSDYGAGRGPDWNFIQDLYEFEDPFCRLQSSDKNGTERSDAMQRGNVCLAERSDGLSPWDGFGAFSAFAIHNYLVGNSGPITGQVYDIQTDGLKDFQIGKHNGFPKMTLQGGDRVYSREPSQPAAPFGQKFKMPGQEQLNADAYLIYGSIHLTQDQANIVYEPIEFNGTIPPVIDPTDPSTFESLKTSPYREYLWDIRDITLKLTYEDGSVLHMLNPYHSPSRTVNSFSIWRGDVCSFALVAPKNGKKLRKVELFERPFCVRGTSNTTAGNIVNPDFNITAQNFMDGATWKAEYVFDIFNIAFAKSEAVTCGNSDGSMTYPFEDNPNQSTVEFSIDGGVSFPYSVADNAGSFTISNLATGTYDVRVRNTDSTFEMRLGEVSISDCYFDCNGVENGTAYEDDCGLCVEGNTGESGILNGSPQGYTYLGDEGQTVSLSATSTVAYGGDCSWIYKTDVSGSLTINNSFFGEDPLPNQAKKAYYLTNGTTIDCNGDANGSAYLDNCNKCVGGNTFRGECQNSSTDPNLNQSPISLSIYPNPVTEQFLNIKLQNYTDPYHLKIYDISGRIVYSQDDIEEVITTVDVSLFSSGIYVANVVIGNDTINRKIIIE